MPHFLQLADISALVFAFLGVYDLLKISMVCKAGRALVDSLSANAFAQATPFELHGWRCRQDLHRVESADRQNERWLLGLSRQADAGGQGNGGDKTAAKCW